MARSVKAHYRKREFPMKMCFATHISAPTQYTMNRKKLGTRCFRALIIRSGQTPNRSCVERNLCGEPTS